MDITMQLLTFEKLEVPPSNQRTEMAMFVAVTIKNVQNYWSNIQGRLSIHSHLDTFGLPLPQWPLISPPPEGIKPLNPPVLLIGAQRLSLDFLNLTYYFGIFLKRFIRINQMERWTKKS